MESAPDKQNNNLCESLNQYNKEKKEMSKCDSWASNALSKRVENGKEKILPIRID